MFKYHAKVKGWVNGKWKQLAISQGDYTAQAMEYSARMLQEQNKGSLCFLLFDMPHGYCTAYTIMVEDMGKPRSAA